MTSSVKISAHCADNKEVVVRLFDADQNAIVEEVILKNGESKEILIYDNRAVTTHERLTPAAP